MSADGSEYMKVLKVVQAGTTHPFGDERSVLQAFPSAIPSVESDPFLMCDNYAFVSEGVEPDPDKFPVNWHPHRGFDILSYLKTGVGRHGDSLGNRETFTTPGMQWISVGSGIEHAEGGATPKGDINKGFQIWVNVPGNRKMDDPRYGTESNLPQVEVGSGVQARPLAGEFGDTVGLFKTSQPVQMVDLEFKANTEYIHTTPNELDTCMVYVYEGSGSINGVELPSTSIALLDASDPSGSRTFRLTSGKTPMAAMVFSGKKLKEPIAWHGPIVMNTDEQIQSTFRELRTGRFPPKRVPYNYKRIADMPKTEL